MAAIACLTHYKRTFQSYLVSNLFDGSIFEQSDNLNDMYCALHVRFLAFKNGVTFVNYVHHFNHLTQNVFDSIGKRFARILQRIGELLMNFFQTGIEELLHKLRTVLQKTYLPSKRKTSCLDFIASNFEDPDQNNRIFNKIFAAISTMLWWSKNHTGTVNKIDKNLDMSKYYIELAKLEEKTFGKATRSMDQIFAVLTTMSDKDYWEPVLPYFPTVTVLWLQMSKYNLPNDDKIVEGQRTHSAEPPSNGRKAAIGCLVSYKESFKIYMQLNPFEKPGIFERNGDRDKLFCALYVRFMAIKNAVPFINRHYLVQYRKNKLKQPVYDSENAEPKKISDLLFRFGEIGTQELLQSLQPLVLSLNLPPKEKERRGFVFKQLEKNRSQNIFDKLSRSMNKMLEWASNDSKMVTKINKQAKDENHFLERLAESEMEFFGKPSLLMDNFFEKLTRTNMDLKYKEPVRMDFEDIVKRDVPNEVEIQRNLGCVVDLIHLIEMNKMKNDYPDFQESVKQWEKNGSEEFVVLYSPIWSNV